MTEAKNRGAWKKEFFPLGLTLSVGKAYNQYIVADKKGALTLTLVDPDAKVEFKPRMVLATVPINYPMVIQYNGDEYTFTAIEDKIEMSKTAKPETATEGTEKEEEGK